jgi:hypothetical protein
MECDRKMVDRKIALRPVKGRPAVGRVAGKAGTEGRKGSEGKGEVRKIGTGDSGFAIFDLRVGGGIGDPSLGMEPVIARWRDRR